MVEQPLTLGEADDWRRRLHGVETDSFENRGAIARHEAVCAERHVYIAEQLKRIRSSIRFIAMMLLIVIHWCATGSEQSAPGTVSRYWFVIRFAYSHVKTSLYRSGME
jgi:hypothetical protein